MRSRGTAGRPLRGDQRPISPRDVCAMCGGRPTDSRGHFKGLTTYNGAKYCPSPCAQQAASAKAEADAIALAGQTCDICGDPLVRVHPDGSGRCRTSGTCSSKRWADAARARRAQGDGS